MVAIREVVMLEPFPKKCTLSLIEIWSPNWRGAGENPRRTETEKFGTDKISEEKHTNVTNQQKPRVCSTLDTQATR